MAIDYNPKDANICWPKGDYDMTLQSVTDKTSKIKADGSGGNPMLELAWTAMNDEGREQSIKDYIVVPSCTFKIKQLAAAFGRKAEFDAGTFQPEDYVGASCRASLDVQESEQFGDQNKIKKYLAEEPARVPEPSPSRQAARVQPPAGSRPASASAGTPGHTVRGSIIERSKANQQTEPPFNEEAQFQPEEIPFTSPRATTSGRGAFTQ